MRQSKKIAITGGIGSGKSTVAAIIAEKYPVISLDKVYADLVKDSGFLKLLCTEFGDVLDKEGELDRKKLSAVVFGNKEKIEKLNRITHPAIYSEAFKRGELLGNICFYEVPLLFESKGEHKFNDVIVVLRDLEKRIECVKKRDNLTEEEVKKRLNCQINYDNYDFARYYVIHNNYDLTDLQKQVDATLKNINDKLN